MNCETVTIKNALLTDAEGLAVLDASLFDYDVISIRQMRYLIRSDSAIVVKAESGGRTMGYMILLTRQRSRILRIYALGVAGDARKLGIGTRLLNFAETFTPSVGCDRIQLQVNRSNSSAIEFYLGRGFRTMKIRDAYYTDGSSAYVLSKNITTGELHDTPMYRSQIH